MQDIVVKSIDEKRQGEAFSGDPSIENSFGKKFFIESYGCSMNFSDSEIVASILNSQGFGATKNEEEADLIFLNTCSSPPLSG
jgi:tRNA-2-methylthio-N6-dimethylallyladenosine synthase